MKYSVRGFIPISDVSGGIVTAINAYTLWRLVTQDSMDDAGGVLFTFEVWVNSSGDKEALFDDLKPFVDIHGGFIDWHVCTHDEPIPTPCVIAETYGGG